METTKEKLIRLAKEGAALPPPTRESIERMIIRHWTGLSVAEIEYLCGTAQDVHPPTDFDDEVQFYLNQMETDEESEKKTR